MRKLVLFLAIMLLLFTAPRADASIPLENADRQLPVNENAQLSDNLKLLEAVAGNWAPEWRHDMPKEEAVLIAEQSLRAIDDLLSFNRHPTGELLLLKGLAAHYAYNLGIPRYYDVAVESLQKARKAIPTDCRPLWFLGNHYSKAGDAEKGMPLLKQAAADCRQPLPVSFWEDYTYAALLAAMPSTGQYALDQVKQRNEGELTVKVKAVEEGVKRMLVAPVSGREYEPAEIWGFGKNGGMTRLSNRMFGFLVDLPGDWRVAPSGVRDDRSGIGITFPKRAKWPPPLEVVVLSAPASPRTGSREALRAFVGSIGTTRKFTTVAGPVLSGGEEIQWLESRQKKGSRILVGALRRPQPSYPGILLESPQNIP
jgi:hypothetical protein